MSQVNVELGRPSTQGISLNDATVRSLAGRPSGTISMNDLRGKSYAPSSVEYLVVAGGGGGGCRSGGGGGAGGYRSSTLAVSAGVNYSISVGGGGSGGPNVNTRGSNGGNSTFASITATGGGGGGSESPINNVTYGNNGGSGGGGRGNTGGLAGAGTAGQGNNGVMSILCTIPLVSLLFACSEAPKVSYETIKLQRPITIDCKGEVYNKGKVTELQISGG
jgi:hypothetical protein